MTDRHVERAQLHHVIHDPKSIPQPKSLFSRVQLPETVTTPLLPEPIQEENEVCFFVVLPLGCIFVLCFIYVVWSLSECF